MILFYRYLDMFNIHQKHHVLIIIILAADIFYLLFYLLRYQVQ